tara:strand:- start:73 stop:264 length:192 start_codon:yes stop_codon:yes gene_type:complete
MKERKPDLMSVEAEMLYDAIDAIAFGENEIKRSPQQNQPFHYRKLNQDTIARIYQAIKELEKS